MPLRLHQIVKDHRPFCREAETCERGSVAAHLRAVNSSDKKVLFFSVLPILEQQRVPFELSAIITIGDDRDRTDNLCLARAALSQLSYVPSNSPALSPQWAYVDSNHGPQLYQSCALTI